MFLDAPVQIVFFRVLNIGDTFMLDIIKDQTFYFKESKGYK